MKFYCATWYSCMITERNGQLIIENTGGNNLNYGHVIGEAENISFIYVVEDTEHFSVLGTCQECRVCRSSCVRRLWMPCRRILHRSKSGMNEKIPVPFIFQKGFLFLN